MTGRMSAKNRKSKAKFHRLFLDESIDQLLAQVRDKDAGSIPGESGLTSQLNKQLAERCLLATEPSFHH